MAISFQKIEEKAPQLVQLAKLSRVELSKKELDGQRAKVVLVLDNSGSMGQTYKSGAMQRLAEKVLAVATGLDDDGNIDFFVFDTSAAYLGEISLDDYVGSIDRLRGNRHMGTTDYAGAFYAVRDHFGFAPPVAAAPPAKKGFFGGLKKELTPTVAPAQQGPADVPVFAVFLTDGGPNSKAQAVKALTEVSTAPIFWKFLSIGREDMAFLQKLDDLTDRFVDNADYKHLGNVDDLTDKDLFKALLDEYPEWVKEVRAKGLIR
jgi:hypothetical protein